ncbi:uncharacterized protein F4812DRAFT_461424 [Daldinia caldariorum]|uniref:uncharacterized protein n=1 Tax=Daldinia caldariorum TaxID=326644 RepID=UPI00200738D7|nr:uncharacterized protein F4812DRAFT_461424 [Daldinia caldariorum]KAI1465732.1 hypothetical protein F4812DRAFT_461424 [Daldinia caldariorum]
MNQGNTTNQSGEAYNMNTEQDYAAPMGQANFSAGPSDGSRGFTSGAQATPPMAMSGPMTYYSTGISTPELTGLVPPPAFNSGYQHQYGPNTNPYYNSYSPNQTPAGMNAGGMGTPGMYMPQQSQGPPHQYNYPQAPTSMPTPSLGSRPTPVSNHPSNAVPPIVQNQATNHATSPAATSDNTPSPGPSNSNHRVRRGRSARNPRSSSDQDDESVQTDGSHPQWRPGMRQTKILDSWSEQRKKATRTRNDWIARCKADHTRKQNRVSARKSRQKKEDALQEARGTAQLLRDQNAALRHQLADLQNTIRQLDDQNEQHRRTITVMESRQATLNRWINRREGRIAEAEARADRQEGPGGMQAQMPLPDSAQTLTAAPGELQNQGPPQSAGPNGNGLGADLALGSEQTRTQPDEDTGAMLGISDFDFPSLSSFFNGQQ